MCRVQKYFEDAVDGWLEIAAPDDRIYKVGIGEGVLVHLMNLCLAHWCGWQCDGVAGSFHVISQEGELVDIRNLGTVTFEILDKHEDKERTIFLDEKRGGMFLFRVLCSF